MSGPGGAKECLPNNRWKFCHWYPSSTCCSNKTLAVAMASNDAATIARLEKLLEQANSRAYQAEQKEETERTRADALRGPAGRDALGRHGEGAANFSTAGIRRRRAGC